MTEIQRKFITMYPRAMMLSNGASTRDLERERDLCICLLSMCTCKRSVLFVQLMSLFPHTDKSMFGRWFGLVWGSCPPVAQPATPLSVNIGILSLHSCFVTTFLPYLFPRILLKHPIERYNDHFYIGLCLTN